MRNKMRSIVIILMLAVTGLFSGCKKEEKIIDVDFTVVAEECKRKKQKISICLFGMETICICV